MSMRRLYFDVYLSHFSEILTSETVQTFSHPEYRIFIECHKIKSNGHQCGLSRKGIISRTYIMNIIITTLSKD